MTGKKALVTGAGIGIGRGIALELGRAGYDVAVHYNSSEARAEKVAEEIQSLGRKAVTVQADLAKPGSARKAVEKALAEFGSLDVYVNNAGITEKCPMPEMTEAFFDELYSVNLRSAYFGVQTAANSMAKAGIKGSVVIIASNHAFLQFADCSCYGILKAGLVKMGRHAAIEYARYGIRVNVIAPGWTDTGEARLGNKEDSYYKIPLKRWCTVEEAGKAAVFLCSDAASSITGSCLVMDGGASLIADKAEKYGL
jgi:NAD(P)-dependent dehydrogenase (short-subunit alcohol dehydrogenase family)